MDQWRALEGLLHSYEMASGHKLNLEKASLFFSSKHKKGGKGGTSSGYWGTNLW